jgi:hypothetical protein
MIRDPVGLEPVGKTFQRSKISAPRYVKSSEAADAIDIETPCITIG